MSHNHGLAQTLSFYVCCTTILVFLPLTRYIVSDNSNHNVAVLLLVSLAFITKSSLIFPHPLILVILTCSYYLPYCSLPSTLSSSCTDADVETEADVSREADSPVQGALASVSSIW